MNDPQFDELTKTLATLTSRRQALKTLGATVVGAVLGLSGIGTVFARCRSAGKKCKKSAQCCKHGVCIGGKCCSRSHACLSTCCASGATCCKGTCCAGTCTDCGSGQTCLLSDPNSCGSCGKVCPANQACFGGLCTCLPPETECSDGSCCLGNCCTGSSGGTICCDPGWPCCLTPGGFPSCCDAGTTCCSGSAGAACCAAGEECCKGSAGTECCPTGKHCCPGSDGTPNCCPTGHCCPSGCC
jgi:hypothetical protein